MKVYHQCLHKSFEAPWSIGRNVEKTRTGFGIVAKSPPVSTTVYFIRVTHLVDNQISSTPRPTTNALITEVYKFVKTKQIQKKK